MRKNKHEIDPEKAILGILISYYELIPQIIKEIKPYHFIDLRHRVIFDRIIKFYKMKIPLLPELLIDSFDNSNYWVEDYIVDIIGYGACFKEIEIYKTKLINRHLKNGL